MIIRIVKLTFMPDKVEEFLEVFESSKEKIRNFDGCRHLDLWRDVMHPNVLFTHSHWDTTEHLDKYRTSDLFNATWAKTKILFSGKPEAWSINKISTAN